eukprot:gene22294-biopygen17716
MEQPRLIRGDAGAACSGKQNVWANHLGGNGQMQMELTQRAGWPRDSVATSLQKKPRPVLQPRASFGSKQYTPRTGGGWDDTRKYTIRAVRHGGGGGGTQGGERDFGHFRRQVWAEMHRLVPSIRRTPARGPGARMGRMGAASLDLPTLGNS